MVEIKEIKEIIDRIKVKGYTIEVVDKRPLVPIVRLDSMQLASNTEYENLKAYLNYLVFYKSDTLDVSYERLKEYLKCILRLEHLKEHGEYPKEVQEIAEYILK